MPSGLENFAQMEFEGSGSQSQSMGYLIMVAKVVGEITRDEQLLAIAQELGKMQQPAPQGPQDQQGPQGPMPGA